MSIITCSFLVQVLLCYQVMLLRFSPKSLQLIWPSVASESVSVSPSKVSCLMYTHIVGKSFTAVA